MNWIDICAIVLIITGLLCTALFIPILITANIEDRRAKAIKSFRERCERIKRTLSILEYSVDRFRHQVKMYDNLERKRQKIEELAKMVAEEIEDIGNGGNEQ